MRIPGPGISKIVVLLMAGISGSAQTPRKIYVDRANGVSFSYPANWLLNADDDAATAKLRIAAEGQPVAVVQLEGNFADEGPYKGTDFEAGAFAYVVSSRKTAESCFAALNPIAGDAQRPVLIRWHGLPAQKLEARYEVAGTADSHQILSVYSSRGRCYVFETVVVSKGAESVNKPLAAARWKAIRAQFADVLQSVRISAGAR